VSDIVEESATFDGAKFRQVLGHFPTGVTVITAMQEGHPVGMAVGSFASLSLDPPQVLFCAGNSSTTFPKIADHGSFTVNILGEDQENVSRVFASQLADKFQELGWKRSANGNPLIEGTLAFIDCTIAQMIDSGDHKVVIGDVTDLDVLHGHGPLVFFRGGYGRFDI
jgi:3-hydroxy-9,10-secoandrosta-1,3,5(10)-triene-9,17-dione monooxygenase reductase component